METEYKIGWAHILLVVLVAVGLAARLHEVHYNFPYIQLIPKWILINGGKDGRMLSFA